MKKVKRTYFIESSQDKKLNDRKVQDKHKSRSASELVRKAIDKLVGK